MRKHVIWIVILAVVMGGSVAVWGAHAWQTRVAAKRKLAYAQELIEQDRPAEALEILANTSLWAAVLRIATPLIFGVLGALLCERSGVLNLGMICRFLIWEGVVVPALFQYFSGVTSRIWRPTR